MASPVMHVVSGTFSYTARRLEWPWKGLLGLYVLHQGIRRAYDPPNPT